MISLYILSQLQYLMHQCPGGDHTEMMGSQFVTRHQNKLNNLRKNYAKFSLATNLNTRLTEAKKKTVDFHDIMSDLRSGIAYIQPIHETKQCAIICAYRGQPPTVCNKEHSRKHQQTSLHHFIKRSNSMKRHQLIPGST